jgi:hypothetical protein
MSTIVWVAALLVGLSLIALGTFLAIIDPRHGSEWLGAPLRGVGGLLTAWAFRRLQRS